MGLRLPLGLLILIAAASMTASSPVGVVAMGLSFLAGSLIRRT